MRKITLVIAGLIAVTALKAQYGVLDNTFGTNGRTITDIVAEDNEGRELVIQSDGKIVVGGKSSTGTIDQFALIRYNTDGTLDNTYGSAGIVLTNVSMGNDVIRGLALQTDGKIVAVGYAGVDNEYMATARYNTDGTLDNTFATNGIDSLLIIDNPGTGDRSVPNDVRIQADGKIVVAGFVKNSVGNLKFAVVRYNTDGTLDTGFGSGGKQIIVFGTGDAELESLEIQPDGKIVIVGHYDNGTDKDVYLARINQFGLDNSFGVNGYTTYDFGLGDDEAWSMVLQSNGNIVVAANADGGSSQDFGILWYDGNGTLTSFGTLLHELGANVDDYPVQLIAQPDDKILVAGVQFGTTQDLVIVRYNTDGNIDNTFGTNGLVIEDINGDNEIAYDIALQADGKIVIAGVSNQDFMVSRYTSGLILGVNEVSVTNDMDIYPNPAKNTLTINTDNLKVEMFKILDVTGKTVQTGAIHLKKINISNLPKGLYFVQIQTEKGITVKRFVKE